MPLFSHPLPPASRIACIPSPRLGDALFMMVTAFNLRQAGHHVTIFSDYIEQLHPWFPHDTIRPATGFPDLASSIQPFDLVIHKYRDTLTTPPHKNQIVLADSPLFKAKLSMADIHQQIGTQVLHLPSPGRVNDLQLKPNITPHKFPKRIIIHPTSFVPHKNWTRPKFIALAHRLLAAGYSPFFITAPDERPPWESVIKQGIPLPAFPTLDATAEFIAESALFIGVDSGIGHLASNLGLPTLSLFLRQGTATQWYPTWSPHRLVLPPKWLLARPMKERFWRHAVSVSRVWNEFERLAVGNHS